MKKIITVTLLCAALTIAAETAHAQNGGFGIGAMINGPTGVSYKAWINQDAAVAGALDLNVGTVSSFYTHADFLMHSSGDDGEFNLESGTLRFFYGGGLQLTFNDATNDTNFGLRVPLGTSYQFEEAPADLFFEFVPTMLFDDFNFGFNGALGFRFYPN